MNTAIYMLSEFSKDVSLRSLSDYIKENNYNSFKGKIQQRRLNMSEEDKKLALERVDKKIRELIKIKLLIDKDIQG